MLFVINFIFLISSASFIAYLLLRLLFFEFNKYEKVFVYFVLVFAWMVFSQMILGFSGLLNFFYLSVFNIYILLFLFVLNLKFKHLQQLSNEKPIFKNINFKIGFFYLPFVILLLLLAIRASMQIVIESDSLTYHLPFVVKWLQNESIWMPYYNAYVGPIGYYPGNYELLSSYLMLPFSGDYLVNFLNLFIYLPLFFAIVSVLKLAGVRNQISWLAPVIFLPTPILIRQSIIPQNDLFFLFTFVVAMYYLLKILFQNKDFKLNDIVLFSISCGLFIGTKANGIVYGVIIILVLLVGLLLKWRPKFVISVFIIFLFNFLMGGFWYFRNFLITGNPVFPLEVKVFAYKIFDGYYGYTEKLKNYSISDHLFDSELYPMFFSALTVSTSLLGLCCIIGVFFSFSKLINFRKNYLVLLLLILSLVFFVIYIFSPFSYINLYPNIRYLLPFLFLSFVLFVLFINSFKKSVLIFSLLSVFFIFTTLFLIFNQSKYIKFANDYVFLSLDFPVFRTYNDIFIRNTKNISEDENKYVVLSDLINAFEFVDSNISENAKIAYTNFGVHYPLFGKKLSREVDYVNVNECTFCVYHDYKYSEKSILRDANFDDWVKNLKIMKKEYLIIAEIFDWSPNFELNWVKLHSDFFELIYKEGVVSIYKIHLL